MKLKRKKIKNNIFYLILIFFLILQIILIAHRSSFSIKYFLSFMKVNVGLEDGIKNKKILNIISLIKKNNIEEFNLSEELLFSKTNQKKIHTKVFQRVVEGSYPSKIKDGSKIIITSNQSKYYMCKKLDSMEKIYVFKC